MFNWEFAIKLSRIAIHVLEDMPPSVPRKGEPVVFVLTSRVRKPKWERARLRGIRRRDCNKEDYWNYVDGNVGEESPEEESSEQVLRVIHIV